MDPKRLFRTVANEGPAMFPLARSFGFESCWLGHGRERDDRAVRRNEEPALRGDRRVIAPGAGDWRAAAGKDRCPGVAIESLQEVVSARPDRPDDGVAFTVGGGHDGRPGAGRGG